MSTAQPIDVRDMAIVHPLAAVTFTQQEWDEMGERGAAWIPATSGASPSG
jgi:hypothetical protein